MRRTGYAVFEPSRTWLLTFVILCAALLLSHPYSGIRHDGILYFGDALVRVVGGEFHDDPYFFYGSQGRFTLLPNAYAALISSFGIGAGSMTGLLLAYALQIVAAMAIVSWLAPPRLRVYCALSVLLGWAIYGGLRVFAYGESFLTARSFAEPLVLLGLAALFRGRYVLTGIALLAALLVHPLMTSGALVLAWLWLLARDRRWLVIVMAGAILYALAGWWGHPPFDDVFARYDNQWDALVYEANPQAFVGLWNANDFGNVLFASTILWLAMRRLDDERVRRVAMAAVTCGLLCLAISYVGVDLLRNPFLGKLQVWRALWLTQWFAMALFPLVAVALWTRGEAGRIAALLLGIGWMAPFSVAPALVAVFALLVDRFAHRTTISKGTTRIVGGLVVAIGLIIAGQQWLRTVRLGLLLDMPPKVIASQMLTVNLFIVVVALAVLVFGRRHARAGGVLAVALLVVAIGVWDQRTPWTRQMESYAPGTTIWPGLIPSDARVYWYRDLIAPWILLGHANFYTQQQGSGAVFSRPMMLELDRRRKVTAILDFQEQLCRMMNGLNEKANACEPDVDAVANVCIDGRIDYVVLQSSLEGTKPLADFATGVVENGYEKNFYLYRCSALKPG